MKPLSLSLRPLAWLAVLCMAAACQRVDDDLLPALATAPQAPDEGGEFWHTGALTRAQKAELQRNYGFGFSYDAVHGGKNDMAAVRCQVLSAAALDEDGLMMTDDTPTLDEVSEAIHSHSEFCQLTNTVAQVSGSVVIYSADYKEVAALYEHGMDTTVCFYSKRDVGLRSVWLDTMALRPLLKENPERYLTPSFRYAISRVQRTPVTNTLVVDSLIALFGTHVVTSSRIGASLTLDTRTRQGVIHDYMSELTITTQKLNLLFVKLETTNSEQDERLVRQVLDNSTLHLSVRGGDISLFGSLVSNPQKGHVAAKEETLDAWTTSIRHDPNDPLRSNAELIDMEVLPIWLFIPDERTARRVQARVIATAPTMQELYGNRNWVNTRISSDVRSVESWVAGEREFYESPPVTNVLAAHRFVATICQEWVPEIDRNASVQVAYPIYENRVDITAGLCAHKGRMYEVSWRYDRFKVRDLGPAPADTRNYYLSFGRLSFEPMKGVEYQDSQRMIDYEWPGSIGSDGTIVQSSVDLVLVCKFLGDFYFKLPGNYSNASPSWFWKERISNDYYFGDTPLKDQGKYSGFPQNPFFHKIRGRMIRSKNYVYTMNKNEVWYEKP